MRKGRAVAVPASAEAAIGTGSGPEVRFRGIRKASAEAVIGTGSGPEVRFCGVRKRPWERFTEEIHDPAKKTHIWLLVPSTLPRRPPMPTTSLPSISVAARPRPIFPPHALPSQPPPPNLLLLCLSQRLQGLILALPPQLLQSCRCLHLHRCRRPGGGRRPGGPPLHRFSPPRPRPPHHRRWPHRLLPSLLDPSRPARPPLVLVLGFGGNAKWQWERQIGPLSRSLDLYVPDLVFFGRSPSDRRCIIECFGWW